MTTLTTTSGTGRTGDAGDRAAWAFLLAHLGFIVFGAVAFVTILAGDLPSLMVGKWTPVIYKYSMMLAPATTVYLGALAALLHSMPRLGAGRAWTMFALASGVALLSELGGTNIGFPFGPYHYTDMLGYKILGDVPIPIPVSWYFMLYGCLAICARLMATDDANATKWKWAIAAGFLLTFWDIPQDPAMTAVQPHHWEWDFDKFPTWVPAFVKTGFFYGMPLSNWIGWVVTGILVARLMLAVMPPTLVRDRVAGSRLPLALYSIGGIMPITVCAKHGMWWAVVPGLVLMYVPVLLALRAGGAPAASRTGLGTPAVALQGD